MFCDSATPCYVTVYCVLACQRLFKETQCCAFAHDSNETPHNTVSVYFIFNKQSDTWRFKTIGYIDFFYDCISNVILCVSI